MWLKLEQASSFDAVDHAGRRFMRIRPLSQRFKIYSTPRLSCKIYRSTLERIARTAMDVLLILSVNHSLKNESATLSLLLHFECGIVLSETSQA